MDFFNAKRLNDYLFEINSALFLDVNPICIKKYLNMTGFDVGETRLPLTKPSSNIIKKLEEIKKIYEN